jgi:REP element-mobilizing transposase RayT
VTLKARLSVLRSQFVFPTVRLALLRAGRRDVERFRIVQFSVQGDHVHLLIEATDKAALSKGMRGLMIRIARYVNDLLMRRGALWADRWHGRALRTPSEVRRALVYVLANFKKHARRGALRNGTDACSSAAWFDGWRDGAPASLTRLAADERLAVMHDAPVSSPRTWLMRVGWRRHGLVGRDEAPSTRDGDARHRPSPSPRRTSP